MAKALEERPQFHPFADLIFANGQVRRLPIVSKRFGPSGWLDIPICTVDGMLVLHFLHNPYLIPDHDVPLYVQTHVDCSHFLDEDNFRSPARSWDEWFARFDCLYPDEHAVGCECLLLFRRYAVRCSGG